MAKKIYLKFGFYVQLKEALVVLPATLTIYDDKGRVEEISSYLSKMPDSLYTSFREWQTYINPNPKNASIRAIKFELINEVANESCPNNSNVNFERIASTFIHELNQWLNQNGWLNEDGKQELKIKKSLDRFHQEISNSKEEIQVFIQTEEKELRTLPWQEWETLRAFCRSPCKAEVAISATDFRRPDQEQRHQLKAQVRILAVFGDERLELDDEKKMIKRLEKYGGKVCILNQPNQQTLKTTLQEHEGWHIFFFAGHSGSDENGRIGWVEIQPDKKVSIGELTNSLEILIRDKLQLAIFNSCDGLGLANQLISLSLPYCIVMRESVDSLVARKLLQHLINSFVKGKSLFTSMYEAREHLRQEFDEVGKHPGKSWLPVIVANPEAKPLTWNGMFTERRVDYRWELFFGAILLTMGVVGLPLSILGEFQSLETLKFYAQLYPHLVVYPSLFLWMALYSLYRMICLTRQSAKLFITLTITAIFLTTVALSVELQSDPVMLFELKANAVAIVHPQELAELLQKQKVSLEELKTIPNDILNIEFTSEGSLILHKQDIEESIRKFIYRSNQRKEKYQGYNDFLRVASSYLVWQKNGEQFSISRWFYAASYFSIFFCPAEGFILAFSILLASESIFKKNKYLVYLIIYELAILLWIPFFSYYTNRVKFFLFSPPFDASLTNLNILLYVSVFSLLILTIFVSITQANTAIYRTFLSITIILIVFINILISLSGLFLIDQLFGINSSSTLITWVGAVAFSLFLFMPITFLINTKVREG